MKRNIYYLATTCFSLCFFTSSLIAQKNYLSIETGYFYGGPDNKISSQLIASGFNAHLTTSYNFFGLGGTTETIYPMISKTKTKYWLRYGRELKKNKTVEVSFGMIHNSEVKGFNSSDEDNYSGFPTGNFLDFRSKLYALTADYIFNAPKKNAGIGIGPAVVFYNLKKESNSLIDNKSYIQPGASFTSFWRFINAKTFFMALRLDAMFLAPAAINEVALTNEDGFKSTFRSAKVNSFTGDVTLSAGFKF